MGVWGITMRESHYGLDLLSIIVKEQLKPIGFSLFDATKAIDLLRQHILDAIIKCNRGCAQEELDSYIEFNYPRDFTKAALLVAECLGEYYTTGEVVVDEHLGKAGGLQERHIKKASVTDETLAVLLREVQRVQNPNHEMYQGWIQDETRQEWLAYIRALQGILEAHR